MSLNLINLDKRVSELEILISELVNWTNFQQPTNETDHVINVKNVLRKETARKSTSGVSKRRKLANSDSSKEEVAVVVENVTVKMEDFEHFDPVEFGFYDETSDVEIKEEPNPFQDELQDEDLLEFGEDLKEKDPSSDEYDEDWNYLDEKPKPKCKKRGFEPCGSYHSLGQQWRRRWRNFEPLFIPSEEEETSKENPIVKMDKLTEEELEGMGVRLRKRDFEDTSEFDRTFCDHKFPTYYLLTKHRKGAHAGEKPSKSCPHCGKTFDRKRSLEEHVRVHTGEKPHKCPHCGFATARIKELRNHVKSHKPKGDDEPASKIYNADDSTFECEYCDRSFVSFIALSAHRKFHKNEEGYCAIKMNRSCPICKKEFRKKKEMDAHIVVHTGEKPFICNFCETAVSTKQGLRRHMRHVHENNPKEKKHLCTFQDCGRSFESKSYLEEHIRQHTGERPFRCDKCPYASAKSDTLKRHFKTHEEASFECGDCGRKLRRNRDFQRHREIYHTGDLLGRKFPCAHCSWDFADEMKLTEHISKSHAEEKTRIRCPHCRKKFDDVGELRSHLESLGEPRWIQRLDEMTENQPSTEDEQSPSTTGNDKQIRQMDLMEGEGGSITQQDENVASSEQVAATTSIYHLF